MGDLGQSFPRQQVSQSQSQSVSDIGLDQSLKIYLRHRNKQKETANVGRQRNGLQKKEQGNSPQELNEMKASNLLDRKFRVMVIRIFNNTKQDIETIIKDQSEIKNAIPEINNTLEETKSRLDEVEESAT